MSEEKTVSFSDFGLCEGLLRSIEDKGYETPTPIQARSIPAILSGRDVLAAAQTGTGKTAGFTVPILQKLSSRPKGKGKRPIKVLILTPTRELAAQVGENVKAYSEHLPLKSQFVFGGVNINPQKSHLRGGVDLLVATPGRLIDLYEQEAFNLEELEYFVLDEADRMLDMGFIRDIQRIMTWMPEQRQTLLFSATFSKDILELTKTLLNDPITIQVNPENSSAETVEQEVYHLDKHHKTAVLKHLIQENQWEQVLVFTRTKHGAERLSKKLQKSSIESQSIHGDKSQSQRLKALDQFKNKKAKVLVATDIAARGLDIKALSHVVNFEIPNVPEDYVHRIGRTGRAGQSGHAISFVSPEEKAFLNRIERLIDKKMTVQQMPLIENLPPAPKEATAKAPVQSKKKEKGKESPAEPQKTNKKKQNAAKAKARKKNRVNPFGSTPKHKKQ